MAVEPLAGNTLYRWWGWQQSLQHAFRLFGLLPHQLTCRSILGHILAAPSANSRVAHSRLICRRDT